MLSMERTKPSGERRSRGSLSARVNHFVDAAERIAQQGQAAHYHPATLIEVWRHAQPVYWARLAVLAAEEPPDGIIRGLVIDEMERRAQGAAELRRGA